MKDNDRAKFKGVVNILIKQDDKYLLFFRNDGFFEYGGGWWVIPAGHIEQGETARTAAIREAKEELDIDINENDMEFAHVISNLASKTDSMDFFFIVHKYTGTIRNCEGDKCAEMRFVSPSEIADLGNVVTTTKIAMEGIESDNHYSELHKYVSNND